MLGTQPIIVILALYQAFNFGTLYLLISGFPALWEGRYGMPRGDASLNYLSLAIGSLIGANICGPVTDYMYAWLKRREGIPEDKPGRPEMRMPLMVPASIITPLALALYGWSAEAKLHFIVPNVSTANMVYLRGWLLILFLVARRCDFRGELHDLLPMHICVYCRRVHATLCVGVSGVCVSPVHVRLPISAVCSGPVWKSGVRMGRECRRGSCRGGRDTGALDHDDLRTEVEKGKSVHAGRGDGRGAGIKGGQGGNRKGLN